MSSDFERVFTVRLPADQYAALEALARDLGLSLAGTVRLALRRLERAEAGRPPAWVEPRQAPPASLRPAPPASLLPAPPPVGPATPHNSPPGLPRRAPKGAKATAGRAVREPAEGAANAFGRLAAMARLLLHPAGPHEPNAGAAPSPVGGGLEHLPAALARELGAAPAPRAPALLARGLEPAQ